MLRIFYSGAKTAQGPQLNPNQSLGGFVSSTELVNGLNNLFGTLSRLTLQTNKPQVRAIVLTNTGTTTISSFKAFFTDTTGQNSDEFDDSYCEFELQYVNLILDSCGSPIFPYSVTNDYQSPLGVTFIANCYNLTNALQLPDLEPDMSIGLWIKRKIKSTALEPLSDETLKAISEGSLILPIEENIDLTFDWIDI